MISYTEADGRSLLNLHLNMTRSTFLLLEVNVEAANGSGIHLQAMFFNKNVKLGYCLAEPFWGEGIITNAVKQMNEFAFNTYDITKIFAQPFSSNTG